MKNIFLLLSFPTLLFSQVNFSEDVSSIIYNNCTECHREGGAGPMSFTSYEEVAALGEMVKYVTQSGYMPPWHADPDYSHFLGERVLTEEEKQLISDWVANGMPQGDPNLEASMPNFPEGSVVGIPDAVFTMEEEYFIEGNNQDDYRVFVFSTNFSEDKYLKSIEIIPGNLSAVHHVLVNIDTEGACAALDASTSEYGYECESGFCIGSIPQLSAGYTPGMVPPIWNNDIGLVLPAGADIAIQMHYAPSSIDEYDQSSVNLFFKDQPVEREVEVLTIVDPQLEIPANEIYTHYNSYEIPFDMSVISVLPHMHLIGKSWLIYAENNEDTIPIISIPDWDFNWQTFYQPEYMLKLPAGYTLHVYATYDNTSSNPSNPNSPPQDLEWGDSSTDEMFFLPFAYVEYQEGDEDIYLGDEDDIGCMDELACNYNLEAIIDDDSCDYTCVGCMEPFACNYDPNALIEDNLTCEFETCVGCMNQEACDYCLECTIPSDCDYSCYGCMDTSACNYDSTATIDLACDYSCYGCMDAIACNYNSNATIDDGNCGIVDDCGVCHTLCCYDLSTQICDYSVSQGNCTNYWPSFEELSSDQNPYWNADCVYGCMDDNACNYSAEAVFDDGSCEGLVGCDLPWMLNYNPILSVDCEGEECGTATCVDNSSCLEYVIGCTDPTACNYDETVNTDDGTCDYSCIFDCCDPCNFDPMCLELGLPECEDPECVGCTDLTACNFDPNATIPDSCEYETCAGCMDPVACNFDPFFTIPTDCDYSCFGCTDSIACNYNPDANNDDGSCYYAEDYYNCNGDCLNDIDNDGICDEVECFTVLCLEFYECVLGDCVCINDTNGDGICDDNVESCLDLDILSINQINPDQFSVTVTNSSADNIFSYPGFLLFNEFGDTIAIEDVDYYGIGAQSVHILDVQEDIEITNSLSLELHTWFYDYLLCEWNDLMISDNCDLEPDVGECDAAIPIYYFNQDNNQCEETWWGGCNGVVPFWNLEDCQNSCQSILISEIESNIDVIKKIDVLGREVYMDKGVVIKIYDDGSVEKEFILIK